MPDVKASRVLRIYGVIVGLLGAVLAIGGAYLLTLGGSPYYLLAGAALVTSAWWLWRSDARGAWLYGVITVATVAWGLLEVGFNALALAPRIALIATLGLVLLLPPVWRRLEWQGAWPRPGSRIAAGAGGAVIVIAALLAPRALPPTVTDSWTAAGPLGPAPTPDATGADWTNFGRDDTGNRYIPSAQISPANVRRLKVAWTFRTGDIPSEHFSFETTPLKVGDKLIVCTPSRQAVALEATTGRLLWRFITPHDTMWRPYPPNCRGVSYYPGQGSDPANSPRIFLSDYGGSLWALDLQTGRPIPSFGRGGSISLLDGLGAMTHRDWVNSTPGVVIGDIIVVGGKITDATSTRMPSGVIRAFDVHSGKLVWAWDAGRPDRTGAPPPGEIYTQSTPNSWAGISADPALSLVFVATGNPSPDFFGGYRRPFDEKYGTSLVALDTRTGRSRWSFQMVHHDLWDQDASSQPLLVDWPTPSGPRKAVVELSKAGDIFVLDRATGKPIVPVREMAVSRRGSVPEDHPSPTQPVSAISLFPRDMRERDMWGLTPIDQMLCRISFRQTRYDGAYTPPGETVGLESPGPAGVISWGGGAIDPRNGILVVNPRYTPWQTRLIRRAKGDVRVLSTREDGFVELGGTPFRYDQRPMLSSLGIPCVQPPWGEIVGIDMLTGKYVWRKALGTGRDSGPLGYRSHIPFAVGTPSFGGATITGGGLVFIAATNDHYLRAIDVRTGHELWRADLPAGGNATPMSYVAGDRQFVVLAAGGNPYIHTRPGDYVLAYSLDGKR